MSPRVLRYMGKPEVSVYEEFVRRYNAENEMAGLKQFLVPYYMSSHPGCTLKDAIELALFIKRSGHRPEQVQDFYPTPGTLSTAMFYTGLDPRDMKPVYVPRDPHEKAMQRALMQYFIPANRPLVLEALRRAGRTDLIGHGPDCLVWDDHRRGNVGETAFPGKASPQAPHEKRHDPRKQARYTDEAPRMRRGGNVEETAKKASPGKYSDPRRKRK